MSTMKIQLIANENGGFAKWEEVPNGSTVERVFAHFMPEGTNSSDYTIRVNRQTVVADAILHENDRVTFSPNKIQGAN